MSTTVLNAYLAPALARYCGDLADGLDAIEVRTKQRFLMQSNGGLVDARGGDAVPVGDEPRIIDLQDEARGDRGISRGGEGRGGVVAHDARVGLDEESLVAEGGTDGVGLVPVELRLQTALQQRKAEAPVLGEAAVGLGALINPLDSDGALRREPLVVRYYDQYFPSLSLATAARSLNLTVKDIKVQRGESVQLGNLTIRTDAESLMHTFYYGEHDGRPAFPVYSFSDVLRGETAMDSFKGKVVLLGATALMPLHAAQPARIQLVEALFRHIEYACDLHPDAYVALEGLQIGLVRPLLRHAAELCGGERRHAGGAAWPQRAVLRHRHGEDGQARGGRLICSPRRAPATWMCIPS